MSSRGGCELPFLESLSDKMNRKAHLNTASEGSDFGMVYEKTVFSRLIRRLLKDHQIRSVCEYPSNNLMGNNSYEFERLGRRVRRLKVLESANEKYDLVWNFCEFEKRENPSSLVQEMLCLSKKYMLIITQNRYNVLMFHRLYHLVKRKKWDHGFIKLMSFGEVLKVLNEFSDLRMVEVGAFDVPWFILDFYEGGGFFRKFVPKSLLSTEKVKESMFENFPLFAKTLLAHHHFVMCEKEH